jgi:hypothetical protein
LRSTPGVPIFFTMPDQPPNPSRVEELLRASAERRRAEFDAADAVAMPARMRQQLHEKIRLQREGAATAVEDEPARESRRPRVGLFEFLFTHFWRRFALVAVVVVALLSVPFAWRAWHPDRGREAVAYSMAPPPPAADHVPLNPGNIALAPPPPPAAPAISSDNAALATAKPPAMLAGRDTETRGPLEVPATGSLNRAGETEAGLHQNFARNDTADASSTQSKTAAAATARTSNAAGVLSNFRFEQTGDRLRIVDADGSVYTGEIQPLRLADAPAPPASRRVPPQAPSAASARGRESDVRGSVASQARPAAPGSRPEIPAAAPAKIPPPASLPVAVAGAAFSFRASGSNVSLHEPVVFEGTYYPALNPERGAPATDANLKLK